MIAIVAYDTRFWEFLPRMFHNPDAINWFKDKGAHTEIQAIKIATPAMAEWVIDKAIQAYGAAGVSQDTPLAALWAQARTLRLADGPDEVHRASLAKRELRRWTSPT